MKKRLGSQKKTPTVPPADEPYKGNSQENPKWLLNSDPATKKREREEREKSAAEEKEKTEAAEAKEKAEAEQRASAEAAAAAANRTQTNTVSKAVVPLFPLLILLLWLPTTPISLYEYTATSYFAQKFISLRIIG